MCVVPSAGCRPTAVERIIARPDTLDVTWTAGRPYGVAVVPDLAPATRHLFRLTAYNAVGASLAGPPNPIVVPVQPFRPEAPRVSFYQVVPPSALVLEWCVTQCHGEPVRSFEVQQREVCVRGGVSGDGDACGSDGRTLVEAGEEAASGHVFTPWHEVSVCACVRVCLRVRVLCVCMCVCVCVCVRVCV